MNTKKLIALIGAFTVVMASAVASIDINAGYYDKRIASGTYDADKAAFINANGIIETSLVPVNVGFEYVNDDVYLVDTWIGTEIGGFSATFITTFFEQDVSPTDYEIVGAYSFSMGPLADVRLGVSLTDSNPGGAIDKVITIPSITMSKSFTLFDTLGILGGLEYGRSIGLDDNYGYLLGYGRITANITNGLGVFVHGSYLKNDATLDNEWDESYYAGVSYSF